MRQVFLFLLCCLMSAMAFAQDPTQLAKSDSLYARGVEFYQAGKYAEAVPLFTESFQIDKVELDSTSNRLFYASMWLSSCLYKLGYEEEAKKLSPNYYRSYPIDRRNAVEADRISQEGLKAIREGDYNKALELFQRSAEMAKEISGENHLWYGDLLNVIATIYESLGNYPEAIRYRTKSLPIFEQTHGRMSAEYAASLNYLALYYNSSGNYHEAIRIGTEVLQIREEVLGKSHPDYAISLHNLASYNSSLGNYSEAIRLCTKALQIREQVLGKSHPGYALSLNNLANYNCSLGNYAESIRLGSEALQIYEQVFGKSHPDYATLLSNLASYNSSLGNYSEAIRIGTEALQIREQVLGKSHSDYAISLNNLANYNNSLGNYSESIRLGSEALRIYERVFGKSHPDYVTFLNNLARYNSSLGNYSEAIRLGSEAMQIFEQVLGKYHSNYAILLNNIAGDYFSLGNYSESVRLGTEAMQIYEQVFGKSHPDYAGVLNNLSLFNSYIGNYSESIRLVNDALRIYEQTLGKSHPNYAATLGNLASYNASLGNYPEAIRLGVESLRITACSSGKDHPNYEQSLVNLTSYHFQNKTYLQATDYAIQTTEASTKLVLNTFRDLPSAERTLFWDKYSGWYLNNLPKFTYYINNTEMRNLSYDGILLSKGLLLNADTEMLKLIMESGDEVLVAKYREQLTNRQMLEKLYEKPIAERFMDTDSLEQVCRRLNDELMAESKVYGDYTRNLSIGWRDVQSKLDGDEAAVEFLSFPVQNDSVMYVAWVIRKGWEQVEMIPLFEKKQLDSLSRRKLYTTPALAELVWHPLAEKLQGVETVYFAPAGELYNIAIEYIPDWTDADREISERWTLHRLSSTRQLALIRDDHTGTDVAVYGGLQYDTDSTALVTNSLQYAPAERDYSFVPVRTVVDSLHLRASVAGVQYLPGTKIEAENIGRTLQDARISTSLYTDTVGTEASFKSLSGKRKRTMHIATHGFYWQESEVASAKMNMGLWQLGDERPRYVEDKALTRSGLMLAGVNHTLLGGALPEGVDDGILTAKEIASLDLRGLDLVVLSACQTGLGEITGDGVFGLQRGFKKAGANTLLMSLWKVDDTATQLLMTRFYANLTSGMSKHEALQDAQHCLRTYERDGTRPYDKPHYWAAFILLDGIELEVKN